MSARLYSSLLLVSTLLASSLLAGCSGFQALPGPGHQSSAQFDNPDVRSRLYDEYQQWQGTPHRLGGLSGRGIDCSGLVYVTFRDEFNTQLPRSTRQQSSQGVPVSRHSLRSGDLVFFDTGVNSRHVGIYIEQDKFLHVSSSRGVMVSYLTSDYWKKRFTHARRVPIH